MPRLMGFDSAHQTIELLVFRCSRVRSAIGQFRSALDQESNIRSASSHGNGPSGTIRGTTTNTFLTPPKMGSCMKKAAEWLAAKSRDEPTRTGRRVRLWPEA